jgi:Holliday junction resolvase RusA-like endonuclease
MTKSTVVSAVGGRPWRIGKGTSAFDLASCSVCACSTGNGKLLIDPNLSYKFELKDITVPPQGSLRVVGGNYLYDNYKAIQQFRAFIGSEVLNVLPRDFRFPDGKFGVFIHVAVFKQAANRRQVITSRRIGDVDKLLRGILDSLSGVLYPDDSFVVGSHITKQLTTFGSSISMHASYLTLPPIISEAPCSSNLTGSSNLTETILAVGTSCPKTNSTIKSINYSRR